MFHDVPNSYNLNILLGPSANPSSQVGHKKTRTGCLTCRQRKVKCDEERPKCHNCIRLQLSCSYAKPVEQPGPSSRPDVSSSEPVSSPETEGSLLSTHYPSFGDPMEVDSDAILPHDRMALRLLHWWMSRGYINYPNVALTEWRKVWLIDMPEMALKHDYLLYALLATAATQLSGTTGPEPDLTVARYKYWSLALSKQQIMVFSNRSDAEPVIFAALLISINAFAMLRDRDIEPYHAPTDWLEVSKGFWKLCPDREDVRPDSALAKIMDDTHFIWGGKKDSIHPIYLPLLQQYSGEDTFEDMEAYEETLAFISDFRNGLQSNEPGYYHVRRVCIFAQMVSRKFIRFLQERRPRALCVLASFFLVVGHSDALSYFGDVNGIIPKREVQSIAQAVPEEWRGVILQLMSDLSS